MARKQRDFEFGPWKGMRYSEELVPGRDYVLHALDMQLLDDGTYWRRPAWDAPRSPSFGNPTAQGIFAFNSAAGTMLIAFAKGDLWKCDGSSWTLLYTNATIASTGITLSTTAQIYGCQFGNVMVFNDGINQPWTWDGGTFVKLTNAPTKCFGKPTVYYAKLFFIKDVASGGADRNTLVWSEENQPNTGYEAGGFNNSWPLVQMGQGPLYAIIGLNDGLYYFRRTSIGVVRGAVTPDFRAAGVHDDVSLEHGTTSPRGVCFYRERIWFVDTTGHPMMFPIGGPMEPLWQQIEGAMGDLGEGSYLMSAADVAAAFVCPVPALDCVTFWMRDGVLTTGGANRTFVFGANGQAWAEWTIPGGGGAGQGIGRYPEDACVLPFGPRPGMVVLVKSDATTNGTWYELDMPTQGLAAGRYSSGSFPDIQIGPSITVVAGDRRGGPLWRFDRLDATVLMGADAFNDTLRLYGAVEPQLVVANPRVLQTRLTTIVLPPSAAGTATTGRRVSWGVQRHGAFAAFQIGEDFNQTLSGAGWGITGIRVRAYPDAVSASMATA